MSTSPQKIAQSEDEIIVAILRNEIEKTLKSVAENKFQHTLSADVLNDYVSSGVEQLLKIYSKDSQDDVITVKEESVDTNQGKKNERELKSILNALALNSQQILDNVHKESQSQLKKQIELQEFVKILSAFKNDESSDEENDDDKNDEDEEELDDEDTEEEQYVGMTEEELSTLIAEAFDNIRRVGRSDGQRLARSVRDAFCEINGREPELRDIAVVFTRIKDKLAEEAKEDGDGELLSSSRNIVIKDDITSADEIVDNTQQKVPSTEDKDNKEITKKLGLLNLDVNTATKEEKEELLKFARSLVREDLEGQAKSQLSKLIGRDPTKQELNDMLIQLATTSLLDCDFDSGDDVSDYNPNANEEQEQFLKDNKETAEFDDENNRETEEPTLINKPVLTTPVKNKGNSSRVDYYFEDYPNDCSQLYINKAIGSFKKSHNRDPNNEELDKMKHFLHTEKANLISADVDEVNKENTSFKLNFGADDSIDVE